MADAKKIVRLNYCAYFADMDDKLFDTTDKAAAEEAGIYDERMTYEPITYIVGSKSFFPDLDAAVAAAEIGKETEVTIPCEKAAGARNPKLIETHPIKEFYKQEINPYPGMPVSLGNKTGIVMSVGAGRVKVDFNNHLAGHDLHYKFTVTEEITDNNEKAKAVINAAFESAEGFEFAFADDKVVITESERCKFDQNWMIAKYKVVSDVREIFGVQRVEFVQVWDNTPKE